MGVDPVTCRAAARCDRLAVAVPTRCFLDLVIPPTPAVAHLRDLLVMARQARLVTPQAMERAIGRARGLPGLAVLRRAVADVLAVEADSPFSDRVHRRLLRDGFRPDPVPAVVSTGRRNLHPDITFSSQRIALECDSMLAHSSQRELMIDNRKDRAYQSVGWISLRIGPLEYDRHWSDFTSDLRHHLSTRGPESSLR